MPIVEGTAKWAYIQTPNTKFAPCWTIDLAPSDPAVLEDFRSKGFRIKQDSQDGLEYVVMKRNVTRKNGQQNNQPRLVDAQKNPIDVQVGNGSRVAVKYTPWDKGEFKGLDLDAVQVLDLVEYGDGDDFDVYDPESDDEF